MTVLFLPVLFLFNGTVSASTPQHDVALIKPLINTNGPEGGYYSQYYFNSLEFLQCGAVVKNTGTNVVNHVFLVFKITDWNNSAIVLRNSDTLQSLNPGESDTVKIPGNIDCQSWIWSNTATHYQFAIHADIDENPVNDTLQIPFPALSEWMWTRVSRSVTPNSSVTVSPSGTLHPGDFIGFTLNIPQGHHFGGYVEFYLADLVYHFGDATAEVYMNGHIMDTASFPVNGIPVQTGWISSDYMYMVQLYPDSTYYVGIRFNNTLSAPLVIGTDTSSWHTYYKETVSQVNGTWGPLNFVPVMHLICDPEGIPENAPPGYAKVYPNPAHKSITVDNVKGAGLELYDLSGRLMMNDDGKDAARNLDVSSLRPGIYLLRISSQNGLFTRKVTVE